MEYKKLEEINQQLKTTDIKGKDYVEVVQRLTAFWQLCENGKIETELISNDNGVCVIKAKVFEDKNDAEPRATGMACEKENSTFINKTSYIENCETSAVGRALGNAGIGINTSVASYEEVSNAILNQNIDKTISKTQADALKQAIENNKIQEVYVLDVLTKYKYYKIEDIKVKDYKDIVDELKRGVEE